MNAARIEMKIRHVGAPARAQYETQPGVWGEASKDGGVDVYRADGAWLGAADRNGHPQAMAQPDRSAEPVVVACAEALLARVGGGYVLIAKWSEGGGWAPAIKASLIESTFTTRDGAIEAANRPGSSVLEAVEWAAVPASVWKAATQ